MSETFSEKAVGACPCPYCPAGSPRAEVRKNVKGKLFLYCPKGPDRTRGHGIQHLNTEEGQEWILQNAEMFGSSGAPVDDSKKEPTSAPTPQPSQAPASPPVQTPKPALAPAPKKSAWEI